MGQPLSDDELWEMARLDDVEELSASVERECEFDLFRERIIELRSLLEENPRLVTRGSDVERLARTAASWAKYIDPALGVTAGINAEPAIVFYECAAHIFTLRLCRDEWLPFAGVHLGDIPQLEEDSDAAEEMLVVDTESKGDSPWEADGVVPIDLPPDPEDLERRIHASDEGDEEAEEIEVSERSSLVALAERIDDLNELLIDRDHQISELLQMIKTLERDMKDVRQELSRLRSARPLH